MWDLFGALKRNWPSRQYWIDHPDVVPTARDWTLWRCSILDNSVWMWAPRYNSVQKPQSHPSIRTPNSSNKCFQVVIHLSIILAQGCLRLSDLVGLSTGTELRSLQLIRCCSALCTSNSCQHIWARWLVIDQFWATCLMMTCAIGYYQFGNVRYLWLPASLSKRQTLSLVIDCFRASFINRMHLLYIISIEFNYVLVRGY